MPAVATFAMASPSSSSASLDKPILTTNISFLEIKLSTKSKPVAREGHCSAIVGKYVYIYGGVTVSASGEIEEKADVWRFDTEKSCWSEVRTSGEKPMSRSAATLCSVDKKLYLFGGLNQTVGWLDDFFVFDTETNTWVEEDEYTGRIPSSRDKLSSAAIGSSIWFFGGFGPQANQRGSLEDEEGDDSEDELQRLAAEQQAAQFGWFDDLYLYDTVTRSWSQPMQLSLGKPSPRCACTMTSYNDTLVIFGGRDAEGRTNDVHFFNTTQRKWLKDRAVIGTPPLARSFHTATRVDDSLVVLGGRGEDNQHFKELSVFDLKTNTWTHYNTSSFSARGCHILESVDNKLYVFGGSSKFDQTIQHCEKFHNDTLTFVLPTTSTDVAEAGDAESSPSKKTKLEESS